MRALTLLLAFACVIACGGDDDAPEEEATPVAADVEQAIHDDLESLSDALAAGNFERVYDDFLWSGCQALVSREVYLGALRDTEEALAENAVRVDGVELLQRDAEDQVIVRVDFTVVRDGEPAPRDPEEPPALRRMVFEAGHWRSQECFGLELTPTAQP
ncbi:MAG: hypothetical protein GEU28_11390 [Dehalococcoidia bacterium]|nr:hypothetical protein [Dehalococcoidia bacterium]